VRKNSLTQLLQERSRVQRLLTPQGFLRWNFLMIQALPRIISRKSLGPIDEGMGECLEFYAADRRLLRMSGCSFGVVREIFGQNCYVDPAKIADARRILDLGGNAGAFALYALSSAAYARVHVVEAQPQFIPIIRDNVEQNGFAARVSLENALVGGAYNEWSRAIRRAHPHIRDFDIAKYLSGVGSCDFIKCDIEGGEYVFFTGDLSWTRLVRRIALEYHGTWSSGTNLKQKLISHGYSVQQREHGRLGYLLAERL
jgi:hypothetical protein